jgi:hypothetical protein
MRNAIALAIILVVAVAGFAQQNLTLSVFTGYSLTAFEDQGSAAGTLPIGLSAGLKVQPALEVGGEFFYPLGGYAFEEQDEDFGKITTTFNQMMAGVYGKYLLGSGNLKPFLKAGVGYYMGNAQAETEGLPKVDVDIDAAVGFNVGAGIESPNGLFAGFTYNIVTREDVGMNTYAVTVGYKLIK